MFFKKSKKNISFNSSDVSYVKQIEHWSGTYCLLVHLEKDIVWLSDKTIKELDLTPKEQSLFEFKSFFKLFPPSEKHVFEREIQRIRSSEIDESQLEVQTLLRRTLQIRLSKPIGSKLKKWICLSVKEIENKEASHSLSLKQQRDFYETILNEIPVDIAVFDHNHRYMFVNPQAIKDKTLRKKIIGMNDLEYCEYRNRDFKIAEQRSNIFNKTIEKKGVIEFEDTIENPLGENQHTLRRFFPVFEHNKNLKYMIGFGIDITNTKKTQLALNHALEEKEALLGEVHHRVKNNLTIVLGMIEMKLQHSSNNEVKSKLQDIQHKIHSLSMIHEKLYGSNDFSRINLKIYLSEFCQYLHGFYDLKKTVAISYDMKTIVVYGKYALFIGLIANEILTNCFKYATQNDNPKIHVQLQEVKNDLILKIKDNGPGIIDDKALNNTNSIGIKLLKMLSKKLNGSIYFENNDGLEVTLIMHNYEKNSNG